MDSTHDDDDDGDDGDGDDDQPFFRVLVECFEKNFTFIKLTKKKIKRIIISCILQYIHDSLFVQLNISFHYTNKRVFYYNKINDGELISTN